MATKDNTLSLSITIKSREKTYYQDDAESLTSLNEKGVFDILPKHSNFITIIEKYVIVHKLDKTSVQFPCAKGVLYVVNNIVAVYLDV